MKEEDLIIKLLEEVRVDQKEHTKELTKQSISLVSLESTVKKNTEDLIYHIRRTDMLEELHKDNSKKIQKNEKRIMTLEEPQKAAEYLKKNWKFYTGAIIAILTILSGIAKLIGLF